LNRSTTTSHQQQQVSAVAAVSAYGGDDGTPGGKNSLAFGIADLLDIQSAIFDYTANASAKNPNYKNC
jgi:hypothetical protein